MEKGERFTGSGQQQWYQEGQNDGLEGKGTSHWCLCSQVPLLKPTRKARLVSCICSPSIPTDKWEMGADEALGSSQAS